MVIIMKNRIRKWLFIPCMLLLVSLGLNESVASATSMCIVKIPVDAKLYFKGILWEDTKAVNMNVETGRIHQLAAVDSGVVYGSKQFVLPEQWSQDTILVIDNAGNPIDPSVLNVGVADYATPNAAFLAGVSPRIHECAVAFHNRVGYGSGGNFANCFLKGSRGYNNAVNSDAGRKWGKPINPPGLASVEVKEIYRYNDDIFSAKVTISSTTVGVYTEVYDLYMLFKKSGKNYYVTDFTYQP